MMFFTTFSMFFKHSLMFLRHFWCILWHFGIFTKSLIFSRNFRCSLPHFWHYLRHFWIYSHTVWCFYHIFDVFCVIFDVFTKTLMLSNCCRLCLEMSRNTIALIFNWFLRVHLALDVTTEVNLNPRWEALLPTNTCCQRCNHRIASNRVFIRYCIH